MILRRSLRKHSSVALLAREAMTNSKWVRHLGLSHTVWKIALCLTVLSDLDVDLAVSWLAQRRRRRKRQSGIRKDASLLRIRQHLTSTVLEHDLADMSSWVDPERATLGVAVLRQATQVANEASVRKRIRQHNDEKGVPLPSSEVRNLWTARNADGDFGIPLPPREAHWKNRLRQTAVWAHRFRQRARVRLGIMRTTEPISLEEKRAKVTKTAPRVLGKFPPGSRDILQPRRAENFPPGSGKPENMGSNSSPRLYLKIN